ncbi:MAG: EAL domain-containing protein [Clostridiales bacterium]|nr:EAL domain-containing protein [Clostridiales bacterium]
MKKELLKLLLEKLPAAQVLEYLDETSFDEMAVVDVQSDRYSNMARTEGRFRITPSEGAYSTLFEYTYEKMVHPDDRETYRRLMAPENLAAQLENAEMPGVFWMEIRLDTVDGAWCAARSVVVGGPRFGMKRGAARCYVYDASRDAAIPLEMLPVGKKNLQRDELTGLLRERDFFILGEQRRRQEKKNWCLIAIDIDHYTLFTDWHGRENGLFVLRRFGEILLRTARETGGLAGYRGQDDFCLMTPYDRPRIDQLYRELKDVVVAVSRTVGFTPLFGISMMDDDTEPIGAVFNHAAMTAEEIKGNVHARIRVYDGTLRRKTMEEYHLLVDFQHALENGEISFWLQPQCRVSSRKIVGAESLARWHRSDGRWVPPAVFVPILERHGIVTNLDKFIWESVCRWLRDFIDRGGKPVPISMNVSPIDLFVIDVPAFLLSLLKKYGLDAGLLKIEITESAYVDDTETVRSTVKRLREMGFLVLMDDFGSGYSSLNMLSSLNVDVIKLDAQFLRLGQQEERKGISILESVINMAKTLSTPVIVEGVESQEQVVFLSDLGCRYMQGYFFHRPMAPGEFEALIADESRIDLQGFQVKANQELHVREFLDENVFSDAMLNNILGPVAFYVWKDDQVDIVRYNQQFYLMVGIELDMLNRRIHGMQDYVYPEDRERFFLMMKAAARDRMNGAGGVFRIYKPSGVIVWIQVHMYYIGEDVRGVRFYGSSQDVTELQYLNTDIPGGYFRCSQEDDFEFQYISRNFLTMTGFTAREIRARFQNRLINMIHPEDRSRVLHDAQALVDGTQKRVRPYRLITKEGEYLYVAEQSQLTDLYGPTCWQCVVVDVTEVMMLRNQMRILARFSSDTIVFTRHSREGLRLELVVHGLEERCGLPWDEFDRALNDGTIYQWVEDGNTLSHDQIGAYFADHTAAYEREFTVHLPNGRHIRLHLKTDRVTDESLGVEYITVLREV